MEVCAHPFFSELRHPGSRMLNGREFPSLFNFTQQGEHVNEYVLHFSLYFRSSVRVSHSLIWYASCGNKSCIYIH